MASCSVCCAVQLNAYDIAVTVEKAEVVEQASEADA
jgi:hypothetical protein